MSSKTNKGVNSHFFPPVSAKMVPYPNVAGLQVPYPANFNRKQSYQSQVQYIPNSMVDSVFSEGISMAPGAKKNHDEKIKQLEVLKKEENEKKERIKERLATARKQSQKNNSTGENNNGGFS